MTYKAVNFFELWQVRDYQEWMKENGPDKLIIWILHICAAGQKNNGLLVRVGAVSLAMV